MRNVEIPLHELAFVAGTRALGGIGIGMLISGFLAPEARRAVGWTLVGLGVLTTVPIAASILRRSDPPLLGFRANNPD
jgi:hypothetical protein